MSASSWILLPIGLAAVGAIELLRRTKKRSKTRAVPAAAHGVAPSAEDDRVMLRSHAIDALSEAVLIMDQHGRVLDCNSSALTLFDRHRAAIEDQSASTLRRFEGPDQGDPHRVASQHAVWVGEAWARHPDGGVKLCQARVIAVRDARAMVTGFVESYRDVTAERAVSDEFRDLLYGIRSLSAISTSPRDSVRAVREELRVLSEAFRDLDLVIRQYERLLPSLAADDPLSESIAGVAHETRAVVAAVGVPTLLEEVPRSLARLRGHLQQLTESLDRTAADERDATEAKPTARG